jgi:voltage-gated potassium channel
VLPEARISWENIRDLTRVLPTALSMLQQLFFALALTTLTVVIHAAGTVHVVIPATGLWKRSTAALSIRRPTWTLIQLVSLLLLLHLIEVAAWAGAYTAGNILPDFETSLYYSLKSYTTVGYGDVLPQVSWRLLGPIEAAVGILMLGWSTSIIVATVQRIYNPRLPSSASEP